MKTMDKEQQFSDNYSDQNNSRFIENFFSGGEFYTDIEDFIFKNFIDEKEEIIELNDDATFECKGSKLEPIFCFSSQWITERISDSRFSENNSEDEIEKITKVLDENINFQKIVELLPKLYYENHKDKFTITKKNLLDAIS